MNLAYRRVARLFGGQVLFAAILVVLVLIIGSAFVIWFFERGVNPNVDNLGSGFYWVFVTIVSGSPWSLENPVSDFAFYVINLLKPGLMALITAALASKLVQFVLRSNTGQGRAKVKDHIVIAGWSSKGTEIIDEIRGRDDEERNRDIVIVAPLKQNPSKDPLTTFVSGDPNSEEDLRRAGIQDARTAIVLADNSYPDIDVEEMDSRTLLATLAIEHINPNCYTCVEVVHSQNREHFARTRANEILVSGRMTGALLAHSAVTHGLSKVIGDLITFPVGNEFYWVDVPDKLEGKPFYEVLSTMKRERECVPVAVAADGEYRTNPPSDFVLKKGHRMLVIAEEDPGAL